MTLARKVPQGKIPGKILSKVCCSKNLPELPKNPPIPTIKNDLIILELIKYAGASVSLVLFQIMLSFQNKIYIAENNLTQNYM